MINNNQQLSWPLPTTRYKGFIFWKVTNDEIPVCWSWQCRDWIGCLVLSLSTMIWLSVLQERAFACLLLLPVLVGCQFFKRGSLLVCCYYQFYLVISSSREDLCWFVVITYFTAGVLCWCSMEYLTERVVRSCLVTFCFRSYISQTGGGMALSTLIPVSSYQHF